MAWSVYREKAAECHHLAETTTQPNVRKGYQALERQWNEIAEREDRRLGSAIRPEQSSIEQ
jgi:hypothetical protein